MVGAGVWDDSSRLGYRADRLMGLAPGTKIGHYDVTALLGEGGMRQLVAVRPVR